MLHGFPLFARDGVLLLGHLRGASDGAIAIAPDLRGSLAKADKFEADLAGAIYRYGARGGLDAPEEPLDGGEFAASAISGEA